MSIPDMSSIRGGFSIKKKNKWDLIKRIRQQKIGGEFFVLLTGKVRLNDHVFREAQLLQTINRLALFFCHL